MNDLERLNDIAIEIKRVMEHMKFQEGINKLYFNVFRQPISEAVTPELKIQITNLENRRKRIVRKMFNKYCK